MTAQKEPTTGLPTTANKLLEGDSPGPKVHAAQADFGANLGHVDEEKNTTEMAGLKIADPDNQ